MFEVFRLQLNQTICYWTRMSDDCSGQFKSRHYVSRLMNSCSNFEQVGFHYYASYKGKNTSYTIGSIVKSALKHGMLKHSEIENQKNS